VDHQLGVLAGHQDDDLEQVAGPIRPDGQPTVGVFAGIFDRERMVDGVWMSWSATPCLRAEA